MTKDWVTGIKMHPVWNLGEPDASGRRRPVEIPGSEYDNRCRHSDHVSWNKPEPADLFHYHWSGY